MLLEVAGLDVRYGRNHAVKGIDLTVDQGEIVTVLGANGAGKSSLLKALAGAEKPAGGRIVFDGEDITGWPAPKWVRAGAVMVPEGRQILISLTVHENLLMGALGGASRRMSAWRARYSTPCLDSLKISIWEWSGPMWH